MLNGDEAQTTEPMRALFAPGGDLARVLPGFESRPQQARMADAVERVLFHGGVGLIEAGTGTGKSLAYLAPAAAYARATGARVVVSTHTLNLQEQLLRKDIPVLQAAFGETRPLTAAVMKGWSNYVCKLRLDEAYHGQSELFPDEGDDLQAVHDWALQTDHGGSKDELPVALADAVWAEISAESDTCVRRSCPFYDDCFFFHARRTVQRADIVIANHHLLCADLAVREQVGWDAEVSVLPRTSRIVFDEAHHLEDVFTGHFGLNVSRTRLRRLFRRINGPRGFIVRLQHRWPQDGEPDALHALTDIVTSSLPKAIVRAETAAETLFVHLDNLAAGRAGDDRGPAKAENAGVQRLAPGQIPMDVWQPLANGLEYLAALMTRASRHVRDGFADEATGEMLGREGEALARRAADTAADLVDLAEADDGRLVYWLERRGRRRDEWALRGAPIEIGPVVQEALLTNVDACVFTSATLSAGDDFAYFKERLGLADWPRLTAQESIPSPFDFSSQVLLGLPDDLPSPDDARFWPALARQLQSWLTASAGRAFVLFTSYGALRNVHRRLAPWLHENDMLALRQGDLPRSRMLDEFRRHPRAVLFGTDSFWEGVDVPGEALSLVVVTRLPFRVPTDPVAQARRNKVVEAGQDAFSDYMLPQAITRLRQGFGRLIRTKTDKGVAIVADNRIITRHYGRRFLNALPRCETVRGKSPTIAAATARWLDT